MNLAERIEKAKKAAPYNHPTTGPDCGGELGYVRGIDCRSRGPTVIGRIVPATRVKKAVLLVTIPTPHDHLVACPYGCVSASAIRRIEKAGSSPRVGARIVPRSRVYMDTAIVTAPHDHLLSRPYRAVRTSRWSTNGVSGGPAVAHRVVSSTCVAGEIITTAPHGHLTACPDSRMIESRIGRIFRAGCDPAVSIRVISRAGIGWSHFRKIACVSFATPNYHFGAGPDRGMESVRSRRVCQRRRSPTVCCGIVSPTRVHEVEGASVIIPTAPHDHFRSRPNGDVSFPT